MKLIIWSVAELPYCKSVVGTVYLYVCVCHVYLYVCVCHVALHVAVQHSHLGTVRVLLQQSSINAEAVNMRSVHTPF